MTEEDRNARIATVPTLGAAARRDLEAPAPPDIPLLKFGYDDSWAVVIGIDRYVSHSIPDLDYAVSDADGLARLLIGPLGFAADRVFVVLDPPPQGLPYRLHADHASKAVIENLLFTQLPDQVKPNDRILVFFAGHGERRHLPGGLEDIGYLVPADAEHERWHTYVDLTAVTRAGNLCAAKHVFYLLDACYSGLATARSAIRERRYEDGMLASRARQVLTAGTAKQAVADRGPSNHSLFTWYVLQGLAGEADLFNTGVITGSQLMVYVRDRVARDFGSEQTPDFGTLPGHESGGDFVFLEPGFRNDEFFELGRGLFEVGRRTGERGRFEAAAAYLEAAVQPTHSDAWLMLGRAQLAAGHTEAATASLRSALQLGNPRALLHLGMVQAKLRSALEAEESLSTFLGRCRDDVDATWSSEFAEGLRCNHGARRLGLLIGYGTGAFDDVRELREVMVRRLGFRASDIVSLVDKEATLAAILASLEDLVSRARPEDSVLVYLAGVGTQVPNVDRSYRTPDGRLAVYLPADFRSGMLSESALVDQLARIPAQDKLLLVDVPHFAIPPAQCRAAGLRFLGGCGRSQLTYTRMVGGKPRGMFTYTLVRTLDEEHARGGLTFAFLLKRLRTALKDDQILSPVHHGDGRSEVYPRLAPDFLWLYELTTRQNPVVLSDAEIDACSDMLAGPPPVPFADGQLFLARALLTRNRFDEATEAAIRAREANPESAEESMLLEVRANLGARRHEGAQLALQRYAEAASGARGYLAEQLMSSMHSVEAHQKHALLVAVGHYDDKELPRVKGAAADAASVRDLLVTRFGFESQNVVTLVGHNASRDSMMRAFESLTRTASSGPAFFYFSGLGSVDAGGDPVVLPADARGGGAADVPITLLHDISAATGDNLVSLIDAGFTVDADPSRFAEPEVAFSYWGGIGAQRRVDERFAIGAFSVFPSSLRFLKGADESAEVQRKDGRRAVRLSTDLFVAACQHDNDSAISRRILRERLVEAGTEVLGRPVDQPLFTNINAFAKVSATLDRIEDLPLRRVAQLLEKLEHSRRATSNWRLVLELGVVRHLLGETRPAQESLIRAIELLEGVDDGDAEMGRAKTDAHWYLGCSLYNEGRYADSVSHFERAVEYDSRSAKANLYHGLSLQKLITLDLSRQIEQSWRTYVQLFEPFGHRAEVTDFLDKLELESDGP